MIESHIPREFLEDFPERRIDFPPCTQRSESGMTRRMWSAIEVAMCLLRLWFQVEIGIPDREDQKAQIVQE